MNKDRVENLDIQAMSDRSNVVSGVLNIVKDLQVECYSKEEASQALIDFLYYFGYMDAVAEYKIIERQKSPTHGNAKD